MHGPGADCHTFEYSSAPWILFLKHSPNILVSKVKKYTSNIFLLNLYLYLSFGRAKVGFYNLFYPPVVWWHRVLMKMGIGNSLWNKFKPAIFQNIITLIVTCHKEKKAIEVGNYKFLLKTRFICNIQIYVISTITLTTIMIFLKLYFSFFCCYVKYLTWVMLQWKDNLAVMTLVSRPTLH